MMRKAIPIAMGHSLVASKAFVEDRVRCYGREDGIN